MEPLDRFQFLLKGLKDCFIFLKLHTSGHMLTAKLRGRFEMKFWGAEDWKICCSVSCLYSVTLTFTV